MERVEFVDADNVPVIDTSLKIQKNAKEKYLNRQVRLEEQVLDVLLQTEKEFRSYYEVLVKEAKLQADIIDKLWSISSRYGIGSRRANPECQYFEKHSVLPEEVLISEYHYVHEDLIKSVETLQQLLAETRPIVLHFRKLYTKLNKNVNTLFIIGSAHLKPIAYFIELMEDLFCYFYCGMSMMEYQAKNFYPTEPKTISEYKKLLEHNEDFQDYLMAGLAYCKCLPTKSEWLTRAGTFGPQTCMERYILPQTKKHCILLVGKTTYWQPRHSPPVTFSIVTEKAFRSLPQKRYITGTCSTSSSKNYD